MAEENREDPNPGEFKKGRLKDGLTQDEASAADQSAYVPPSAPGRWGGRAILGLQKIIDKVLAGRVVQLQGQVIEQDKELSELTHDIGQLNAQVVQMNRRLRSIDERLARLEEMNNSPDPE